MHEKCVYACFLKDCFKKQRCKAKKEERQMNRKIKVALAGLGSRGKDTYAKAAELFPEKWKSLPLQISILRK